MGPGKENKMDKNECKYFDDCSSPLCPHDPDNEYIVWFPDEDICKLRDVPGWVKKQRKIAKKVSGYDTCFTKKMLEHNCKITTVGIDPNKDKDNEERKWIRNHKKKKKVSSEQIKKRTEALKRYRSTLS